MHTFTLPHEMPLPPLPLVTLTLLLLLLPTLHLPLPYSRNTTRANSANMIVIGNQTIAAGPPTLKACQLFDPDGKNIQLCRAIFNVQTSGSSSPGVADAYFQITGESFDAGDGTMIQKFPFYFEFEDTSTPKIVDVTLAACMQARLGLGLRSGSGLELVHAGPNYNPNPDTPDSCMQATAPIYLTPTLTWSMLCAGY